MSCFTMSLLAVMMILSVVHSQSPRPPRRELMTLSQSDFDDGTVTITSNNVRIEISEDIVFNPKSDWSTSPNQEGAYFCDSDNADVFEGCDKTQGSFRLGFFAVISLEGSNIVLDLMGHSISFGKEFRLQQRFGAIVSVGKGPFIQGQGMTTFGSNTNANDIEITNGILGSSSHHGIHGNFVNNIEIHNLIIKDFEVAGIQLNGFNNAYLHDLDIGPSSTRVPVRSLYSHARFGLLSFRDMKKRLEQLPQKMLKKRYSITFADGRTYTAVEIIKRLMKGMDLYFDFSINDKFPKLGSGDHSLLFEAWKLFDNQWGLPDGSALYGILLNSAGGASGWFGFASTDYSQNAVLENINIHQLNLKLDETITYFTPQTQITGPYKGVLPMDTLLNLDNFDASTFDLATDSMNNYVGNILSDAEIALASFGQGQSEVQGTIVTDEFIGWSKGENALTEGFLMCNGDCMLHMNKGTIGIRIDRTNNITITDLNIKYINNWSKFGSDFCVQTNTATNAPSKIYQTHPQTPNTKENNKYQGRVSRAIALTDVSGNINLQNIDIDSIISSHGSAIGIELLGDTEYEVELGGNVNIKNINSCSQLTNDQLEFVTSDAAFPNNKVISCALYKTNQFAIYDESNEIELKLQTNNIQGPQLCTESIISLTYNNNNEN